MKYALLFLALLSLPAFCMEQEKPEQKLKSAQVVTSKQQQGWLEAMRWLTLSYQEEINKENIPNAANHLNNIKKLLQDPIAQECINKETENIKETILNIACSKNLTDIAELFLNAGADPNIMSSGSQETPLLAACIKEAPGLSNVNCTSLAQLLIDRGALVNTRGGNSLGTPLHRARQKSTLDILLQAGANTQIKDRFGATPLIERAVDMNIYHQNKDHESLFEERIKAIKESVPSFLRYGTNIYEKDPASGKTAYELLKPYMSDLDEIIEIGKQECAKRIIQQLARKTQQKLQNDWLKFAQSTHFVQSSIIKVGNTQFPYSAAIASARCPALMY